MILLKTGLLRSVSPWPDSPPTMLILVTIAQRKTGRILIYDNAPIKQPHYRETAFLLADQNGYARAQLRSPPSLANIATKLPIASPWRA